MLAIILSNGENALRARFLYRYRIFFALFFSSDEKDSSLLSWKNLSKSSQKFIEFSYYVCIGGFYMTTNNNDDDTLNGF